MKFIILTRHGEVDISPEDKIYNRDEHMTPIDIVHISQKGKKQLFRIGQKLRKKGFKVKKILTSPETRTKESAEKLIAGFGDKNLSYQVNNNLDEIDDPKAYLAGIKMKDLLNISNNLALQKKIQAVDYSPEEPASVAQRMLKIFNNSAKNLSAGQTDILISHGHPIAILTHQLLNPKKPAIDGEKLRSKPFYCPKGNALICQISPVNQLINISFLFKKKQGITL